MAKARKLKRMGAMAQRPVAPGMSPGVVLAAPEGAYRTSIDVLIYDEATFTRHDDISVSAIPEITAGKVVWVHVVGLGSIDVINALAERFQLHKLLVEDLFTVESRPKAETYGDKLFVQLKLPPHESGGPMDQMSIIASKGLIISIDEAPGDCFEPVRGRLEKQGPIRTQGADYLLYALIDAVADGFFPALEREGTVLDLLEDSLRNPKHTPPLATVHSVKRHLLAMRRVVWPLRELIASLMRENQVLISDPVKLYLRDTYDHSMELVDLIELYRETANGLAELSLAIVSARMNDVMKFLTIISTIFMPLTFIVGIYGMNFDRRSPLNMPELGWKYGYVFSLGLMAAIAIGFLIYFRRRGLLGRPGESLEDV
jgi:magnesium transporter